MKKIKIAFSDEYILDLPEGHKFPISKYKLIPEILLREKLVGYDNIFAPKFADLSIVELTHSGEYLNKLVNLSLSDKEIRRIGFPQTKELIEREFMIAQGTTQGALFALEAGVSLNVAGGTHHAFADRGEGFCVLNDIAVAANYLLHRGYVNKILIVDLDVHQGNGTAKIFESTPEVFTFSIHGADNFPLRKEKSDLDIPLALGTDDKTYLKILSDNLPKLIDIVDPDFIFYLSGVDVLKNDRWGRMNLSLEGVSERDKFVISLANKRNIPIMISMGGGYSPNIDEIVQAHCETFRVAFEIFGNV